MAKFLELFKKSSVLEKLMRHLVDRNLRETRLHHTLLDHFRAECQEEIQKGLKGIPIDLLPEFLLFQQNIRDIADACQVLRNRRILVITESEERSECIPCTYE